MIKLNEIGKSFLWTTQIDLPDSSDGSKNYITLREPNQKEIVNLSDDGSKNLEMLEKILPNCIIDSTIVKEDGTKATGSEIANALKDSGSLFTEILTTWLESIPFQSRLKKGERSGKSDK